MSKQLRSKKSTVANTVATFNQIQTLPQPTESLDERELDYFNRIVQSREVTTWSPHDLALATDLALTQVQYLDAMHAVKTQGRTMLNDRGTPVVNPETGALNQLSGAVRAFTATLGLSASQRGVAGAKQTSRNQAEQQARAVIARASEDDLLA
jgi:phage terminase small subunit